MKNHSCVVLVTYKSGRSDTTVISKDTPEELTAELNRMIYALQCDDTVTDYNIYTMNRV